MQSKFAYVYFYSLDCCDWCCLQHLLFIVLQLYNWIGTWVGDEVSTVSKCLLPKCLLCQNVYCGKMSIVPKCLLWQNVDSQNVYLAKMSAVPKCPLAKCLLSRLNPEGPFGKEISLIHKEFSRHFCILIKTLQPVLTVYNKFVSGKCMIFSIFYQLFAFLLPKLHAWRYLYISQTKFRRLHHW